VPYLGAALRWRPLRALGLWAAPFAVLAFLVRRDHGRLKSRLIRALLGGMTRADVATLTKRFLDKKGASLFHARALAALEGHRARGDYLVILSASTDNYVPAIGERLKVDEVICTLLVWNGDRLDGALASPNRRGPEKTRCIEELRARHPGARFAAYGNAGSDIDHLTRVEDGLLVNASAADRARAVALGLPTADWH
jgi:HAD superfamily phosphoserine phosphatase-like hydrolase